MSASATVPKSVAFSGFVLGLLLLMALILIVVGLTAPALKITSMYVFTREYSILGGILSLFEDGQTLLGVILLLFSVVFPLAKNLLALFCVLILERRPRQVRRIVSVIGQLSKWSMVDVFAIALVVLVMNGQLLSSANIDAGVGMFAAGVLLSTLATFGLERISHKLSRSEILTVKPTSLPDR